MHPRFGGIGVAASYVAGVVCTYYHALIALITMYIIRTFAKDLPWLPASAVYERCKPLSEAACAAEDACSWRNNGCTGNALTAASNFLNSEVLHEAPGEWPSRVIWTTVGCALLAYVASYLSLFKGARVTGSISTISVVGPALFLLLLAVQGATLEGAIEGIRGYIGHWDLAQAFSSPAMWSAAISQNMFSLSICQAIMIAYASHAAKSNTAALSTLAVAAANHFIEFVAGFAVFAVAGHLAHLSGIPLSELPLAALKLVFVAYPVGLSSLPFGVSHLVCALFFVMLWVIGVSSAFAILKGFSSLLDESHLRDKWGVSPAWTTLLSSCAMAALTVLFCTDTGMQLLDVVDFYITRYVTMLVGLGECTLVGFFFLTGRQDVLLTSLPRHALVAGYVGGPLLCALLYGVACALGLGGSQVVVVALACTALLSMALGLALAGFLAVRRGARKGLGARAAVWTLLLDGVEDLRAISNGDAPIHANDPPVRSDVPAPGAAAHPPSSPGSSSPSRAHRGETRLRSPMPASASPSVRVAMDATPSPPRGQPDAAEASAAPQPPPVRLPLLWSVLIKFICPPVFVMLFAVSLPAFGKYGGFSLGFNAIGMGLTAVGVALIIIGAVNPHIFDAFDQRTVRTRPAMLKIIAAHAAEKRRPSRLPSLPCAAQPGAMLGRQQCQGTGDSESSASVQSLNAFLSPTKSFKSEHWREQSDADLQDSPSPSRKKVPKNSCVSQL